MIFTGKIEYKNIGTGTWALVTDTGSTYQLRKAPKELKQVGITVKIQGQIRSDLMTTAAIGPVLEVQSFEEI